jgi:hypothetical protein
MAMRDPGTPGRNPFFDHGPDPEPDFDPDDPERTSSGADPGADPGDDPYAGGPFGLGGDPLGSLAALVDALQDVQPEATEHLVAAAHELVLAVKTVVDATEAVLAAQRAAGRTPASATGTTSEDPPPAPPSGVRRIDLA